MTVCLFLSPTQESNLRTPRPMRLRVLGLGDDIMSPTARWSWKSLVFWAIMYCSAQKYGTSSTAQDKGDHDGKYDGGCRNNTTLSVEYTSNGSKSVLELGPAMSPSGNTRPREDDAKTNPWFLASGLASLGGGKARESALTASEKWQNLRCQPVVASLDICASAMSPFGNTDPRLFGPVVSPCGSTRPREQDASPNLGFLVLLTRWRRLERSRPRCIRKRVQHRRCQPVGSLVGHLGMQCPPLGTPVLVSLGL